MQLKEDNEDYTKHLKAGMKKDKKQMLAFETVGIKGKYLTSLHDYLLTTKPTSVDAERAFSAAGYICSSVRSRLRDRTIDVICFLRLYFQNEK